MKANAQLEPDTTHASSVLGRWAALAVCGIGVAYVPVLAAALVTLGVSVPIVDPFLAVMESLTLTSAVLMVVLMAAINDRARGEQRVHGAIGMAFMELFAGTTCVVHFVQLTSNRQLGSRGLVWPSTSYAAELVAWNLFLGLALIAAAQVFTRGARERLVSRTLLLSGLLCVAGVIGPLVGHMRLQVVGIVGYALVLPVACFLLAAHFDHEMTPAAP